MAEGRWRYAVREIDEDGDQTIWTSHSVYTHEPFWSAEEARDFARPWLENYEIVRTWIPTPHWEPVPEGES